MSALALGVAERALSGAPYRPPALLPELAVAVVAHTDASDPWTTPTSRALAARILRTHAALLATPQVLRDRILEDTLKPLFSAPSAQSAAHRYLTPAARIALRPSTQRAPALAEPAPPWRRTRPETVTLLHWTVRTLPAPLIEPSWHLLIPPILTILDNPYPPSKTRGCNILTTLLARLDELPLLRGGQSLLTRTGLGPVIWDAVTPSLLSLPPLTPAAHSVPLLAAAYPALIALSASMTAGKPTQKDRAKLLDKLVRDGIVRGMQFGGESVTVATALMEALGLVVGAMGVWAVRHLKVVVPMVADVLGSPFGTTYVPLLEAAVGALKVVLRVCWVRVGPWVPEVLRGVCACWNRVGEEEREKGVVFSGRGDVVALKKGLREVVEMLRAVMKGEEGEGGKLEGLEIEAVGADGRLKELFASGDIPWNNPKELSTSDNT